MTSGLRGGARGGLRRRLLAITPRRFAGIAYRVIGSRFLTSPLASAGLRARGGRVDQGGTFEVLYAALAADTALAERDGVLLTARGIKATRAIRTGVLLRLECRLTAELDLTDETVHTGLGLSMAEVLAPWLAWQREDAISRLPPTQELGVAVHATRRFEALLYPSTKNPAGRCLAVLPDCLRPRSLVAVDDPDGAIRATLGLRPATDQQR